MECSSCHERPVFANHTLYRKHMVQYHQNDGNFKLPCVDELCPRVFYNYGTYRSHISRVHKPVRLDPNLADVPAPNVMMENDNPQGLVQDAEDNPQGHQVEAEDHQEYLEQEAEGSDGNDLDEENDDETMSEGEVEMEHVNLRKLETSFVLGLRAMSNVSQPVLQNVMSSVESIVQNRLEQFASGLEEQLQARGIRLGDHVDINSMVARSCSVFEDLDTRYKQDRAFEMLSNYVPPQVITLGQTVRIGGAAEICANRPLSLQQHNVMFVPISQTLHALRKNDFFMRLCQGRNGDNEPRHVINSLYDGTYWRESVFLQDHPDAFPVNLYYDEATLNDTVSSRPHKLGFFYFELANLSSEEKASLKWKHLVSVFEASLIGTYGMNAVLQPIVDDLLSLEDGIVEHGEPSLFAILASFIGDNLASHGVGGFKEGFTATCPCRQCKATLNQVRTLVKEDPTLLRTVEDHNLTVEALASAPTKADRDKISTECGVNRNSELNRLKFYHVVNGMPPDAMHDILEGAFPIVIKNLLAYVCLEAGLLDLDLLNSKIYDFDYGYSESSSRPSKIKREYLTSDSVNLHQTASQYWMLGVTLPFILVTLMSEESEHFRNLKLLLEISAIILGHSISVDMIDYLRVIIEDFLESFQEIYRTLTPKLHFLTHYPSFLCRYGPLCHFWSMRMEAKHQYFKHLMHSIRNFKNPPKSLANHHQYYQAFLLENKGNDHAKHEMGPLKRMGRASCRFSHILPPDMDVLLYTQWIKVKGIKYKAGKVLLVVKYSKNLPVFVVLDFIILINKEPFFVCREVSGVEFYPCLCSYKVVPTQTFCGNLYRIQDLLVPFVYETHTFKDMQFVILKRCFGDMY